MLDWSRQSQVNSGSKREKQTSALKGKCVTESVAIFNHLYNPPSDHKLFAFLLNPKYTLSLLLDILSSIHYSIGARSEMLHINHPQE